MTKCQLSSTGSVIIYEFYYNPCDYDAKDDYSPTVQPILHGAAGCQTLAFDSRPRVLKWENLTTATGVETMISAFRARIGKPYYIKFNEMGQLNHNWPGWTTYTAWYPIRIIDIKTKSKRGGQLQYESIELWVTPRQ